MSYNTRYYASFYDINKDKIDIYIKQNGFVGEPSSLILDVNPLVISYPTQEFTSPIFSGGCKINIINNSADFFRYDNLFSVPQKTNKVEIIKTSNNLDASIVIFEGYILPEMYTSTLEKNIKLTISATDQLAQLDKHSPLALIDTSTFRAREFIPAFDIIYSSLYNVSLPMNVAVNNTLYHDNYVKNPYTTVFNNIFLDANNFSDTQGVQTSQTILEKILKSFYCRLYRFNNKFIIERNKDLFTENKQFSIYRDTSVNTYIDVSNGRINLSNHSLLSKTAQLTYNPGYQKIIVNLAPVQPVNLVDNYYYGNSFKYYGPEISTMFPDVGPVNVTLPYPKLRNWMLSALDGSLYKDIYSDSNIKSGFTFTLGMPYGAPSTTAKWNWLLNQFATTMFQFNKNKNMDTVVTVYYKYSLDPANVKMGNWIKGRFALRTLDRWGRNWWIAKAYETDINTFWSDTPYTFEKKLNVSTNTMNGNTTLFEMTETINITAPLNTEVQPLSTDVEYVPYFENSGAVSVYHPGPDPNSGDPEHGIPHDLGYYTYVSWGTPAGTISNVYPVTKTYNIPATNQYVQTMYLDVYCLGKGTDGNQFSGFKTMIGDVKVNIAAEEIKTIIEGSLSEFNDTKEIALDVFDVETCLYTNGVYSRDSSLFLRTVKNWKDSSMDQPYTLQNRLLQDLAQEYGKPRYQLSLDIRSKDSSMWTLGNVFTHNSMRYPDSSLIEFICNGYDYNVKESAYRLNLMEFIDDDNWRIDVVPYVEPAKYFSVIPPYNVSFNGDGNKNDHGYVDYFAFIEVSTNITFHTEEDPCTMEWARPSAGYAIYCDVNYGDARDGSITWVPDLSAFSSVKINVHQDASIDRNPGGSWIYTNPASFIVPAEGNHREFDLYSNTSWSVVPDYGWVEPATGSGNATITLYYPSYYVDILEWNVYCETDDHADSCNVFISQNGAY